MNVIRNIGVDDPRVADYRNVSDAELLRRANLYVAEGRLVVTRAIEAQHHVASVLVNDASLVALHEPLATLPVETPIYVCDTRDFAALTGYNLHRGSVALVRRPAVRTVRDIADSGNIIVALDSVSDADNVGSVFRNAAAFGAGSVILNSASCDPLYRKAIRTSMGSTLKVPWTRSENWLADLTVLKRRDFAIVALTPREPSIELDGVTNNLRGRRVVLMVGSEATGLSSESEALADVRVRVPIRKDVDSLNVATAAAIALYSLTRTCP